ncbi:hypothetical protein [uncultured Sphingorhabdus sp.]|uniref:hypothetical protein n=1 Tax=uncultured Sphingorhabdus sp. TaxID=1686106 RepID=UPI00262AFB5A|nr:hypothetical protein [uncultured Sphingorhabdus sp.]HMS20065.1 hypothetical protein [Sphingorhabdus sp.]
MADIVSASIAIGGTVSATQFAELATLIAEYDLRVEWGGKPFDPNHLPQDDALRLFAEEAAWGMFDDLEQFCCDEGLAYQRWSGACAGSFGAERIVYDGSMNGPWNFAVDEDDHIVLHAQTIEELGSMRAIRKYIAQAEIIFAAFNSPTSLIAFLAADGGEPARGPVRRRRTRRFRWLSCRWSHWGATEPSRNPHRVDRGQGLREDRRQQLHGPF